MASIKSGYCQYCGKQVECKQYINHTLHILLCLSTCGLWLIIYLLIVLFTKFTCPFCGQEVLAETIDPKLKK